MRQEEKTVFSLRIGLAGPNNKGDQGMRTHQFNLKSISLIATVVFVLTLAMSVFLETNFAIAQTNRGRIWSSAAVACVPDASTIHNNKMDTSRRAVRFKEGKTGEISLNCPITDASLHGTVVRQIEMSFRSKGSTGLVAADLLKVSKADTLSYSVLRVLDSDTKPCLIDSTQLGNFYYICSGGPSGTGGAHRLNFDYYDYYVSLVLRRSNPDDDVRLRGVSISSW